MFHVTTQSLGSYPVDDEGHPDPSKDFFGKPANLTVSGQLNGETYAAAFRNIYTSVSYTHLDVYKRQPLY